MWKSKNNKVTIKEAVEKTLQRHPICRDEDIELLLQVYRYLNYEIVSYTGYMLLKHMQTGEIPSIETISRWRRRLQQLHPEYRGTKWHLRHDYQAQVKQELGYIEHE